MTDLPITQWYCEKGCGAILNGESREFHKCKGGADFKRLPPDNFGEAPPEMSSTWIQCPGCMGYFIALDFGNHIESCDPNIKYGKYGIEAFEKQIANLEAPETAPALPWKLEFYQGGSGHTCAACKIWSYPLYALGIPPDKFVLYLCINCKDEVIKAVEEYKETNDR